MDTSGMDMDREELVQMLHTAQAKITQLQKNYEDALSMETEYNTLELKYKDVENELYLTARAKEKADEEIETLKELLEKENIECNRLTEELEEAQKKPDSAPIISPKCDCHSRIFALETEAEHRNNEIQSLRNQILEMTKQFGELESNYQSTARQLEEITSLYEAKREELETSRQMIESLTEDKVLLESELNLLRAPSVDLDQRGNSLFAEVEDKRKSTAKNLEVMKTKYNKLSQQFNKAQEELKKLKDENIELLNEASNDKVRRIEAKMMESYRTRIADLEKQVAVYSKRPESPIIKTIDLPDLPMVSAMLERARTDAETLRRDLLRKSHSESERATQCYMAERKLRLAESSMKAKEKELQELKAQVSELEEAKEAYRKLKEEVESGSKENGEPKAIKKTRFVHFSPSTLGEARQENNKPKLVKQPKAFSTPVVLAKPQGPVLIVSNELKRNKDSLKKAE